MVNFIYGMFWSNNLEKSDQKSILSWRCHQFKRKRRYSAAQIYPNYAYAYYTLVFCVYTYVYTRICVCEYTRICPFVMSFCRTNEISLSLDLNVKDGNNFCVGVSKPWLFVDPCLLIAIQLCWNFKPYCFYFFPKSALLNWRCSLSTDAAYTWTFTVPARSLRRCY